jgi:predicted Zn-ribbon and HTH transcriptional regulator
MVEDSATHLASDASEPVTTTPEKIDGEKKIAYPTPVARRTYRLSEEKGFAVEITQEPQTPKEAENYVHTIPHEQVIEAHRPMDESSSEVEQVESKALGIVSDVKAQPKGEFKDIGSYSLENVTTGLLLPIGNNNIINTQDHQIEIYLKKPALLSLDKRTSVRLIKILDIHELMLKDGRIRLKLIEESGLWTIRGRDISLSLTPNSDVVVDMTGSLITRIFVLEGSIHCMEATGKKPIHIEAGQHISIGLNDSITTETKSSTTEFIKEYLSLKGVEGKKHDLIAAAHAFHDEANAQWPVSNKLYSGIICTQCNYAFGKKEEALSHCPECKVSLISKIHPSKQKINSNPWILGLNKIGNKFAY